jgi:hypothetical protein
MVIARIGHRDRSVGAKRRSWWRVRGWVVRPREKDAEERVGKQRTSDVTESSLWANEDPLMTEGWTYLRQIGPTAIRLKDRQIMQTRSPEISPLGRPMPAQCPLRHRIA